MKGFIKGFLLGSCIWLVIGFLCFAMSGCECKSSKENSYHVFQKPKRCKKLLRFSVTGRYIMVAECINLEGNKAVFRERINEYSNDWQELVMVERD
jgi:hypothetical protein